MGTRKLMSAHWRRCTAAKRRAFTLPASHTCVAGDAAGAGPQTQAHAAGSDRSLAIAFSCAPDVAGRRGSPSSDHRSTALGASAPSSAEPCGLGLPVTIGWPGPARARHSGRAARQRAASQRGTVFSAIVLPLLFCPDATG